MKAVRNIHERDIEAPAEAVGALLDRLATDDDPLFPTPGWPPMRFDRPLGPGADGGHGPITYRVVSYEPGRRIRFDFTDAAGGFHELTIAPLGEAADPGAGRCRVRHELVMASPSLTDRLGWALVIRWAHDVVIEELLDNAERAATGRVCAPYRRSPWARLVHRMLFPRPEATELPASAVLARQAFPEPDFADAWRLELRPGMPRHPRAWRKVLPFPVLAQEGGELLLGEDSRHGDFRASLLVEGDYVTLSTVARTRTALGRAYFGVVRHIHPYAARWVLRRMARRLALTAPSAGERHGTTPATNSKVPGPTSV
ncbi:DUF2867 domain-containing protein [Streptomyces sp. A7024]|uniref:DUF2867 domain-containing protein n=1 Tax=Streptomyces coryli TaxID=1128680 RepID=A0A6G4TT98_9ACTN|nr:DUF2867 domain-containing protein [Streptomyces coryli]NGN62686.1 DUF2867 domain-containing protein [Streptomyces coryli]